MTINNNIIIIIIIIKLQLSFRPVAVVLNTYTSTWHCATKIYIYIGAGATWEACSDILDIWEPPQHLLSRHRENKKENLYLGGRSQDLPNTDIWNIIRENLLRKQKWQIPGEPLTAQCNCTGLRPGGWETLAYSP